MVTNDVVTVIRDGTVAVVWIDNPPVSALSRNVRQGMLEAFQQLHHDRSLEVIVISARIGGRFIAGTDIREMDRPVEEFFLPDVTDALDRLPQKTLAAIDGSALGGDMEIALACDVRMGSPSATLGLTESRLGIIPGAGGTQRLARLVGIPQAIRLIVEGRILRAAEAVELGLLDHIADGNLVQRAIEIAPVVAKRRLSEQPVPIVDPSEQKKAITAAFKKAKSKAAADEAVRVLSLSSDMSFEEGLASERDAFLRLREGPEAKALRTCSKRSEKQAKFRVWRMQGLGPFSGSPSLAVAPWASGLLQAFWMQVSRSISLNETTHLLSQPARGCMTYTSAESKQDVWLKKMPTGGSDVI